MNPQLILLISIFFFMSIRLHDLKAQSDSTQVAQQSETILKINPNTGTPFSKGQTKWIDHRGFNTSPYDWENPEVNLMLKKSIHGRDISRVLLVSSYVLVIGGLIAVKDDTFEENPFKFHPLIFAGSLTFIGSLTINQIARKKVRKAEGLRLKIGHQ